MHCWESGWQVADSVDIPQYAFFFGCCELLNRELAFVSLLRAHSLDMLLHCLIQLFTYMAGKLHTGYLSAA